VGEAKFKFEELAYGSMENGRRKYWGVTNARLWKVINARMKEIRDGTCFALFRINFKDESSIIIRNNGFIPVCMASYTNYMITQTLKQVGVTNSAWKVQTFINQNEYFFLVGQVAQSA
jgi:hypothetical protein